MTSLPLANGTILQNRYRISQLLGQGGFGRTYLAEDQGRFNELCAVKEFIAPHGDPTVLAKAKELFQREAATLYQIQHPQVPQFKANFTEGDRLFLVQDYVEGKTFLDLLNEQKAYGRNLTEAAVKQLLVSLLPVLAYIHSKGIIHRDISPDNIMLRRQDTLPVLIDFGVVKEIATKFIGTPGMAAATTVGKLGYAPSEQVQAGRAYPSSDLYALAVTAIVLLTGREPQELYDDTQLTWQWQRWVEVDPQLVLVINKMLSYRPGDRYQSAQDVLQALKGLTPEISAAPTQSPYPDTNPPVTAPPPSQVRTVAVGGIHPLGASTNTQQNNPIIPTAEGNGALPVILIGLSMATAAAVIGFTAASLFSGGSQQTIATPSPTTSPSASPTPTVTPSPSPTPSQTAASLTQKISLEAGDSRTERGNLKANQILNYVVRGEKGQKLNVSLNGEGVLLSVLRENQRVLVQGVQSWSGTLPANGDYTISLRPAPGVPETDFRFNISLEAAPVPATPASPPSPSPTRTPPSPSPSPSPTQTPSPKPSEAPTPSNEVIPLSVSAGQQTVSDRLTPLQTKDYLVNVQRGQGLSLQVTSGQVVMDIYGPDGRIIADAGGVNFFDADVPVTGEYRIRVRANERSNDRTDYSVRVGVRNLSP